jgi:hypothetical protein
MDTTLHPPQVAAAVRDVAAALIRLADVLERQAEPVLVVEVEDEEPALECAADRLPEIP